MHAQGGSGSVRSTIAFSPDIETMMHQCESVSRIRCGFLKHGYLRFAVDDKPTTLPHAPLTSFRR
jgi:hypothetical protein